MGRTPPGQTRKRIFDFVQQRLLAGFPPTVREVQEAFGFRSVQTAREHLETLVAEGRLAKQKGKARGYGLPAKTQAGERAIHAGARTIQVPLLGQVAAGGLSTAIENLEGYIPIEANLSPGELFALRIQGDSMTGAGILAGDIAVVRRQPSAQSGDIVVALVEDEATVKRLHIQGRRVELHPENPFYKPIAPDPDTLTILGKVIEIRRYMDRS